MDHAQALEITRLLADGIDPSTGEEFPSESPYQQPKIIRALFLANQAMEHRAEQLRRKRNLPANAGEPWSDEEDRRLVSRFEADASIRELATEHARTMGAIQARLVKLGKIAPP
jgi:hypothetical protein